MNRTERSITRSTAELVQGASTYMATIAGLVSDDLLEQASDGGKPFLDGFRLDGLMQGLRLVSERLSERAEWLNCTVMQEEEAEEEEENKAALARRPGKNTLDRTNVGEQS